MLLDCVNLIKLSINYNKNKNKQTKQLEQSFSESLLHYIMFYSYHIYNLCLISRNDLAFYDNQTSCSTWQVLHCIAEAVTEIVTIVRNILIFHENTLNMQQQTDCVLLY